MIDLDKLAKPIHGGSEAENRHLEDFIRPDGRMEVYALGPTPDGKGYECFWCSHHPDKAARRHEPPNAFLCAPINSPDASAKIICLDHCPDNVVIFDPTTGKCRDKTGENVWEEKQAAPELLQ